MIPPKRMNAHIVGPEAGDENDERTARRWPTYLRPGADAARIEAQRNADAWRNAAIRHDSFGDPDYIRLYGMKPAEWYARGVRLLGRTAVECTRDSLGDCIGRDVANVAASLPPQTRFTVIDPFAGSCNTLYWILRHVPHSVGIAFESDLRVYEITKRNIERLDRTIALKHGDYELLIDSQEVAGDHAIIVFVAPPWGTALDEAIGLDLRQTMPPITDIIGRIGRKYSGHKILFATQVYEKVNPESLEELQAILDWSELRLYGLNVAGRNHGVLLGTRGWKPQRRIPTSA